MQQLFKSIPVVFFLISATISSSAQVGIGTSSSVDPSARLQIDANGSTNAKGLLPPRVELTSTTSNLPFTITPAAGLLVYNTARAGNVTPGFYFFDGTKWLRMIDQQPDATVSFDQNTPTTGGVVFTPNTQNSTDHIYVSSTNNSHWIYNGSAYVTYTPPATTAWLATAGVDAGSNKSSSIYRSGKVGIGGNTAPNATLDVRTNPTSASDPGAGYLGVGTTDAAAAAAAAGALRYSNLSGGVLEYSNGTAWNTLSSSVQKANVYATRLALSVFNVAHSTTTAYSFGNFSSSSGAGTGQLNNTTGIYTAPRTGLYSVSAGMSFLLKSASNAGVFHFLVMKNGLTGTEVCNQTVPINFPINQPLSANISCAVQLTAGETVQIKYLNWTNATVEVALDPNYQGRYYFTVTEN